LKIMPLSLRHELIAAPGATPTHNVLFLHGILGAGTNLRSLAKRFVAKQPQWQGVLVDLRAHGGSLGRDGDDTVEQAAGDVAALIRQLALPTAAIVAHSFGGKVALLVAADASPNLGHVALIDSAPGTRFDHRGSELTLQVLEILDSLGQQTWASRDDFVRALVARGQDRGVALWLAMNVAAVDGRYRFTLELPRIHALLESYFGLDTWPVLEHGSTTAFHLIIGERSAVYDEGERARAQSLAADSEGRITIDVLPAGHWVHVDDFEGLLRVLLARIQPR
jgi:pimeloyl-ACP methyl ester carboxylesterase